MFVTVVFALVYNFLGISKVSFSIPLVRSQLYLFIPKSGMFSVSCGYS